MPAKASHPVCDWDEIDGHWIARLGTDRDGYCQSRRVAYRGMMAHRAMWLHAGREIPEGMELDHTCRVRNCVNPDHLEPVPHGVNISRGAKQKLTDEQVAAIRQDGRPRSEIAADYGVAREYVWALQRGKYRA